MAQQPDHVQDISKFLSFDQIRHFSIGADLNILWSSLPAPTPIDDQLVGLIRRIIVRTWQEQMFESDERPETFTNFIQLSGDKDKAETFLLSIQVVHDGADETSDPIYNAIAQKVTCPLENGVNGAAVDGTEWKSSKAFRKFLHKLSNPLSIISGFSQYMLEKSPQDSPDREFLEEIFTNARRIRDLIDEAALPAKSGPLPPSEEQEG